MSDHPHDPAHPSAQGSYPFDPAQQHHGAAGDPHMAQPGSEGLADEDGSWFLQDDSAEHTSAVTDQFEAVGALPDELGAAPVAGDWDEEAHADEWMEDGTGGDAPVSPLNDEDLVGASFVEPESTRGAVARALVPGVIVLVLTFGAVGAMAVMKDGSFDRLLGSGEAPDVDTRRTAPKRGPQGPGADLASIDGSGGVGTRMGRMRDGSTFEVGGSKPTVEAPREPGELAPADASPPPSMEITDAAADGAERAREFAETAAAASAETFDAAGDAAADSAAEFGAEATDLAEAAESEVAEAIAESDPFEAAESFDLTEAFGGTTAPAPEALAASETLDEEPAALESVVDPLGRFGVAVPVEPFTFTDESFVALEDAPEGVFGPSSSTGGTPTPETPATENPLAATFASVGHQPDEPAFPLELVFATRGASEEGAAPAIADASPEATPADEEGPAPEELAGPGVGETFAYVPFGFDAGADGDVDVSVSERDVSVAPMGPTPGEPATPVRTDGSEQASASTPMTGDAEDVATAVGASPSTTVEESDDGSAAEIAAAESRLDEVFGPVRSGAPLDPIAPEAPAGPTADAVAATDEPERSTVFPLPSEDGAEAGPAVSTGPPAVVPMGPTLDGDPAPPAGVDVADGEDSGTTKPGTTKPGTTKPGTNEPGTNKPGGTKPGGTKPGGTRPGGTKPGSAAGEEVADAEAEVRPSIASQVEQKRRGGVLNRIDDGSVWQHRTVPKTKIRGDKFVLTPMVGNVRVVFAGGETIDGRLHGVGAGQVVLFTKIGRVKLESKRVDRIDRLGGSRELPDPTKQASRKGLDHVRVRTKGGVFDGHLVSRDGNKVTLLMGQGVRVTLDAVEVTPFKGVRAGTRIRRQDDGKDGGDAEASGGKDADGK